MPETDVLKIERKDAVAMLTLNRPDRRNALSPELDEALRNAFADLNDDESIRAVVLTGRGKGFCSGADLQAFEGLQDPQDVYDHLMTRYLPLIELITTAPKPVIAAVNGVATGAGCALALACDLRLMADDAELIVGFSRIGLVPDMGASWLLVRQIGYARAFKLAATANPLPANRCAELGLANRTVSSDSLIDEALSWAHRLAKLPTKTLGLTKEALYEASYLSLEDAVQREAELQREAASTRDHKEGVQAFLEKREPNFTGE